MLKPVVILPPRSVYYWSSFLLQENDQSAILAARLTSKSVSKIERVLYFERYEFYWQDALNRIAEKIGFEVAELSGLDCLLLEIEPSEALHSLIGTSDTTTVFLALLGDGQGVVISGTAPKIYDDIEIM